MTSAAVVTDPDAPAPAAAAGSATGAVAVPPPVRTRLIPLLEPPARPLLATGPPLAAPPVAGSPRAAARSAGGADPWTARPALPVGAVQDTPLPDPTPVCCAMVQAAVEALRGARPLAQLARWVSPEIYDQLDARAKLTQRVRGADGAHRAAIRRIRLCRLGESTAEATVVVDDGPRVRAVAVRLEGRRGQWRATALEIG
jgi:hypothetical protein